MRGGRQPRYSPVYSISTAFLMLLMSAGLLLSLDDKPSVRLTLARVAGVLLGVWMFQQLLTKRSVTIWAWEVKGSACLALVGLGGLLGGLAAYGLLTQILR